MAPWTEPHHYTPMLTHLSIRDFAIIDAVDLDLRAGLTALTGETGAGKSILVDAVMLAIGGRATADVIRHGAERAEVTATFDPRGLPGVAEWLEAQSIPAEEELLLRRVIGPEGRSRAWANGQLLPLGAVRELGQLLIDIHGQQEFLSLMRREPQRSLLDAHGDHTALLLPVARLAKEHRALAAEVAGLRAAAAERDSRLELLRYQVRELEALGLKDGEVPELLTEHARLANRSRLAEAAQAALALTYEGDNQDAHALASRALAQVRGVSEFDPRLQPVEGLLAEALIQLKEAGAALSGYLDNLEVDPRRQAYVETRIGSIDELARKHRLPAEGLLAQLTTLQTELSRLENAETTVVALEQQLSAVRANYDRAAEALTRSRRSAAEDLSGQVTSLMKVLGMPGGTFAVDVRPRDSAEPAQEGQDDVEFLVSANPGQPPKPVAKVASGGELSRISLAVQVAAAAGTQGRLCMIFDEVDAGVGGGVAERVGRQLRALGARGQVLCVTHLAQVASQADHHVRVAKLTDGKTSRTTLAALGAAERVEELARMLGGVELTQAAREHAREMLAARDTEQSVEGATPTSAKTPSAAAKAARAPASPGAAPRRGAGNSRGGSARKE